MGVNMQNTLLEAPGTTKHTVELIAALSAPFPRELPLLPTAAALLLDATGLHAEALRHAEDRLYTLYRSAAAAYADRHLILAAPTPSDLCNKALLPAHLCAALRVSPLCRLSLLFPPIGTVAEIDALRRLTEQAMCDLLRRGLPFDELVESYLSVGSLAALEQARVFAEDADRLVLDIDRLAASAAEPSQEALLAAICSAAEDAHAVGRRAVAMGAGLLAGDLLPALVEAGVDALILPAAHLEPAAARLGALCPC